MLKSCSYCGKIHPSGFLCPKKPPRKKRGYGERSDDKGQTAFRNTYRWQCKRDEIRARDLNTCRYHLSQGRVICADLSVHHITPLSEAYDARLDDANLITLCSACHEAAEANEISRSVLYALAKSPPALES